MRRSRLIMSTATPLESGCSVRPSARDIVRFAADLLSRPLGLAYWPICEKARCRPDPLGCREAAIWAALVRRGVVR
jgi:hypothetical protein